MQAAAVEWNQEKIYLHRRVDSASVEPWDVPTKEGVAERLQKVYVHSYDKEHGHFPPTGCEGWLLLLADFSRTRNPPRVSPWPGMCHTEHRNGPPQLYRHSLGMIWKGHIYQKHLKHYISYRTKKVTLTFEVSKSNRHVINWCIWTS